MTRKTRQICCFRLSFVAFRVDLIVSFLERLMGLAAPVKYVLVVGVGFVYSGLDAKGSVSI